MASTYSPNLRLELMGSGENENTWGTKANNVFQLIEDAVAGYVEIACGGGGSITLSTANGATDEARNMVVDLTGSPAANFTIVVPNKEKVYIIRNATGKIATIQTATPTTSVAVAAGLSDIVFSYTPNNVISILKRLNRAFPFTTSAVNYVEQTETVTGSSPIIRPAGGDANQDLKLNPIGTGSVMLGGSNMKFPNTTGSSGQLLQTDGTAQLSWVTPAARQGWYGFTLSRSDATTLGIAAGIARSDDNAVNIELTSAFTKTLSSFVAGTGNGGLASGAIAASTWYIVYSIYNPTTGASDVTFEKTSIAITLPTGFTKKRRVSHFLTNSSSQIVNFLQFGDTYLWVDATLDVDEALSNASRTVITPLGIVSEANLNVALVNTSDSLGIIQPTAVTNNSPSVTASPLGTLNTNTNLPSDAGFANIKVLTDTTSQVRIRNSTSTTTRIVTLGWRDLRAD